MITVHKYQYILFCFVVLISTLFSCDKDTPPVEQKDNFIKFYGDAYENLAMDMIQVDDKYYLLMNRNDGNENWFRVQCVDDYGNTVGEPLEIIGNENQNYWANSITRLSDNNLAIVGKFNPNIDSDTTDIYLLIIDEELNKITDTIYNYSQFEEGFFIEERTEGGYLITGIRDFGVGEINQRFSQVLDNNLNTTDTITTDIKNSQLGSSIPDGNGGFLLCGGGVSLNPDKACVIEQTSVGKDVDVFLSENDAFFNEVKIVNYPEMVVCGTSGNENAYVSLFNIREIDATWGYEYEGDNASSITLTSDNNILVAGSRTVSDGKTNIYVFKLDMNGSLLDEKLIGGTDNEYSVKILADPDNNSFIVFGVSYVGENSSAVLVKSSFD